MALVAALPITGVIALHDLTPLVVFTLDLPS